MHCVRSLKKMHSFDNAISLKDEKLAVVLRFHYSAIVARAYGYCFSRRQTPQKLAEQLVFTHVATANFRLRTNPCGALTGRGRTDFHGEKISGNARAARVSELKSECIVIATRMEPLHSYAITKQLPKTNNGTNDGRWACAAANSSARNVTPSRRPKT